MCSGWSTAILRATKRSVTQCPSQALREPLEPHPRHLHKHQPRHTKDVPGAAQALSKFGRIYAYIAQLIDLGDPDLENYAAFSKLLANRLDGVVPEEVDLRGITLTGYDIKPREEEPDPDGPVDTPLEPIKGGGADPRKGATPIYIQEIIEKLNSLFGEAAPLGDQMAFVNQVAAIARENPTVMAQVEKNSKDQATLPTNRCIGASFCSGKIILVARHLLRFAGVLACKYINDRAAWH